MDLPAQLRFFYQHYLVGNASSRRCDGAAIPSLCVWAHAHPTNNMCSWIWGTESPEEKREWQTSSSCFHVFGAKCEPAATCLYFPVENQQGLGEEKKKTQQNISFKCSSVAEVVG